jgi:hypothetical protein
MVLKGTVEAVHATPDDAGIAPADGDVGILYDHFAPFVLTQWEGFGFCGPGGERTSRPTRCRSTRTGGSSERRTCTG